jgi:hypothetical protein
MHNMFINPGYKTPLFVSFIFILGALSAAEPSSAFSTVLLNADGSEAVYSDRGDRLPDFSMVGYRFGERDEHPAIADLPTVRVDIASLGEDAAEQIQEVIDQVAAMPILADGYRGVVRLGPGSVVLDKALVIASSGVILAGEAGEDATELVIRRDTDSAVVRIEGDGMLQVDLASASGIVADYVPVGESAIEVDNVEAFAVGDSIIVRYAVNDDWITTLGMDQIPPRYQTRGGVRVNVVEQWQAADYVYDYQRKVVAIEGNTLYLNIPMVQGLDREFGETTIMRYEFPGRIENVGVRDLHFRAEFDDSIRERNNHLEGPEYHFTDERNARSAVYINNAQHVWVTRCVSRNFYHGMVNVNRMGSHVTVSHCQSLDPVSRVDGARRYAFYLFGQLNLVKHCYSREGRHDFTTPSRVPGPNVFYDCLAENAYSGSEPHHRMSKGILYDNVRVWGPGACLAVLNRGNNGSGHGWMGAQTIFWNCASPLIIAQSPPIGENFAVGESESYERSGAVFEANLEFRLSRTNLRSGMNFEWDGVTPFIGDGYFESKDRPVNPRSLYRHQLERRLSQAQ